MSKALFSQNMSLPFGRKADSCALWATSAVETQEFGFRLKLAFLGCGINTNSVNVQLEDPFGYDRADIKVDAIVEDLRVRTVLRACLAQLPLHALYKQESPIDKIDC